MSSSDCRPSCSRRSSAASAFESPLLIEASIELRVDPVAVGALNFRLTSTAPQGPTTITLTGEDITDPFGNLVGLVQGDGNTNVSAGDNPPVDWFELSCSEPEKAWDFYRELFGWTVEESSGEGYQHASVNPGAGACRGGIGTSQAGRPMVATRPIVIAQATETNRQSLDVSLEIPIDAATRRANIERFLERLGRESTAAGKGEVFQRLAQDHATAVATFERMYMENLVGDFEVACAYASHERGTWNGELESPAL